MTTVIIEMGDDGGYSLPTMGLTSYDENPSLLPIAHALPGVVANISVIS